MILQTIISTTGGGAEPATITITGTNEVKILYVDVNGVLQFASCSPGTILQSYVGSMIIFSWGSGTAIKQQVTGIDTQFAYSNAAGVFTPLPFEKFYEMTRSYSYCGIIQNSEATIYAETD